MGDEDLRCLEGLDHLVVLSLNGTRVAPEAAAGLRLKRLRTVLVGGEPIRFNTSGR
jgi:uroporphyrinogen-III synthase